MLRHGDLSTKDEPFEITDRDMLSFPWTRELSDANAILRIMPELELEKNINNVNNIILDLGQMGIEVDDPTLGVVNFNSLRGIETVFLSYRLGEKNVNHWHHLDENYECRRKMERELDIITQ